MPVISELNRNNFWIKWLQFYRTIPFVNTIVKSVWNLLKIVHKLVYMHLVLLLGYNSRTNYDEHIKSTKIHNQRAQVIWGMKDPHIGTLTSEGQDPNSSAWKQNALSGQGEGADPLSFPSAALQYPTPTCDCQEQPLWRASCSGKEGSRTPHPMLEEPP